MSVVDTMHSKRVTDEVRHAQDDLEFFYLEAKRNKKIAYWAAKKLDLNKKDYFMEILAADLSKAGPKPVIDRILDDFEMAGMEINEQEVWEKLRTFEREILQDMMAAQAKKVRAQTREELCAENKEKLCAQIKMKKAKKKK